jgi:hypothetical protein
MKVESTYKIATGGDEPSAETVLSINRAAQAIGMDDQVGLALMTVMRAQNDKIESIPERINEALIELERDARRKVDVVIAKAVATAVPDLTKAVVATAEKVAGDKAKTEKEKWFIAALVTCLLAISIATAGGYFYAVGQIKSASATGYETGLQQGYQSSTEESKKLVAWAHTKVGELVLKLQDSNQDQLESIVLCSQKGWTIITDKQQKRWCITHNKTSGWILP